VLAVDTDSAYCAAETGYQHAHVEGCFSWTSRESSTASAKCYKPCSCCGKPDCAHDATLWCGSIVSGNRASTRCQTAGKQYCTDR
jgi:hypothetical protein